MPTVVPVRFHYAARDLWFDPSDADPVEGDHVICSTARGTEIGLVMRDPEEVSEEEAASVAGEGGLKPVLRIADDADLEKAEELADRGEQAMPTFRSLVKELGLDMKPVGVEYLFGGEKVVCYFAAEERVDFRQLVRDLSRTLHERIDMRQIGVREEAALMGGYAHCGQELCCARFGTQFEPVSIRMAKEQDLPLNSSKISGVCGRLMCCLRYEFEAYRDFKGRAPKKNAVIDTPLGKAKIVEYDTPKEQLVLRIESGKTMRVSLSDMTASEAAHKKSEELGCPCRPDTVSREVLDSLDSPEIKMALAELDRENGVVQEEEYESEDIFVEPRRKRRRASRQSSGEGAQKSQERSAQKTRQSKAGKSKAASGSGQSAGKATAKDADEGAANPRRRRRRRRSSGGQSKQQAEQGTSAKQGSSPQGEKAAQPKTRRRHPGDKGGKQASSASSSSAPSEGASKPRPRRRHRGSGGKNGSNGSGQQNNGNPSSKGE
jgi:cell fate regulator YaaT (PSP1 superfamily)